MIQSDQIRDLKEENIEENGIGAEYSWENRIRPLMRILRPFYGSAHCWAHKNALGRIKKIYERITTRKPLQSG